MDEMNQEDNFFDDLDDEEDEIFDNHANIDDIQSHEDHSTTSTEETESRLNTERSTNAIASNIVDDNFISDDEDSTDTFSDASQSDTSGDTNYRLSQALKQTYDVLDRCRKLTKVIRNSGIIDQFTRNHPGGPKNGFILDICVSSLNFYL